MTREILVALDRSDASADGLEHVFREYPGARILAVYVTEAADPLGLFGVRDPAEYMVVDCECDLDEALLPPEGPFTRGQRRRAEHVLDRACTVADAYDRELEPIVRSGDTAEEIAACAADRAVDRVVLTASRRRVLGAVRRRLPEAVARHTDVPVTVVGQSSASQPSTTSDRAQSESSKRVSSTPLIVMFRRLARELYL